MAGLEPALSEVHRLGGARQPPVRRLPRRRARADAGLLRPHDREPARLSGERRLDIVQPMKIAIMAMGGEGGGVLADWIVDLGEANGHLAQTTSVPGVAQRTGATIYYVELYPAARAEADGAQPVLALMPLPGDVDVVLASELMEAGRAIQRGLVTPDRTTLRRLDAPRLFDHREDARSATAGSTATRCSRTPQRRRSASSASTWRQVAEQNGSVISAVLFGALAGTGVLPFAAAQFEETIARGGVGVASSLRAFDAGVRAGAGRRGRRAGAGGRAAARRRRRAARGRRARRHDRRAADAATATIRRRSRRPRDADRRPARSARCSIAIEPSFPRRRAPIAEGRRAPPDRLAGPGLRRRSTSIAWRRSRRCAGADGRLLDETARHLALWMTYEDTIRVAALKTRGSRFERVQRRGPGRPTTRCSRSTSTCIRGVQRDLPRRCRPALGRWLERPGWPRRLVERFTQQGPGRHHQLAAAASSCSTAVAGLRRWRRSTSRFAAENAAHRGLAGAASPRIAAAIPRSPSRWRSASAWSRATATRTSAACATSRR